MVLLQIEFLKAIKESSSFYREYNKQGMIVVYCLLKDLEDALDNLPLDAVHNCWFQQDSAPHHSCSPIPV